MWTTWCTVARGRQAADNNVSGGPQHRGRPHHRNLLADSCFYSFLNNKIYYFLKHENTLFIYLFIKLYVMTMANK